MRLDKYLAHLQVGTRSEVKQLIRNKKVTVDGATIRDPSYALAEDATVVVAGKRISGELDVLYIMNKPAGVITATTDANAKTVLDLIAPDDRRPGLFPVGRLDKDTTGLLLLTTDGALGHALLAPSRHVAKTYVASLDAELTPDMMAQLEAGVVFKDFTSAPAEVTLRDPKTAAITIHEGKFHQVKRMFHAVGVEVITLQRVAMGDLRLPADLPAGSYRAVTTTERAQLTAQ
ncbi:pseudouridine synthase [Lacticaseibacillus sp. GG6-2]